MFDEFGKYSVQQLQDAARVETKLIDKNHLSAVKLNKIISETVINLNKRTTYRS